MATISYEGIDEATLIHALYHGTISCGFGTPARAIEAGHGGGRVTVDVVRSDLAACPAGDVIGFDYYRGRPLKVHLDTKSKAFDPRLYDRDAGTGAAERIIGELRAPKAGSR